MTIPFTEKDKAAFTVWVAAMYRVSSEWRDALDDLDSDAFLRDKLVFFEAALGDGVKKPMPSEIENIAATRKVLVAARPIKKGEIFTEENLTVKRPGLQPKYIRDNLRRQKRAAK